MSALAAEGSVEQLFLLQLQERVADLQENLGHVSRRLKKKIVFDYFATNE